MEEQQIQSLMANQRFLIWEMQKRGIAVELVDFEREILQPGALGEVFI